MAVDLVDILIPLLLTIGYLAKPHETILQPTRNVSVQLDNLKNGPINVYFTCPNIRSKEDKMLYYKVSEGEKGLIKKRKGFGIVLRIKSESDLGAYECSVASKDGTTRNATLNIIDSKKMESATKLTYNEAQTKYVIHKSGSVELDCGAQANEMVTWYRPPQFHIYTGSKLKIETLTKFDYGTYYCVVGSTAKSTLPVNKVILLPEEPKQKEKRIDEDVLFIESFIPKSSEVRFKPTEVAGKFDTVTWEQPPGTILLDHGRNLYFQSYSLNTPKTPFYYRIHRNGDPLINKAGKVFLAEWEEKENQVTLEGAVQYGNDMTINCFSDPESINDTNVIWRLDDKIIHRGNAYTIKNFQKKYFGKYSCEIERGGVRIISRAINLAPEQDLAAKIEMTPDPGSFYNFHSGRNKELHCEIQREDGNWKFKSKDVIWTFNGRKMDFENPESPFGNKKRFGRLDTRSVSILVLKELGEDNKGVYKCFQGSAVFAATLLMEQSEILVELSPPEQTAADNVNQMAEFHCRIDTPNYNSSFIRWSFIPEGSDKEEKVPAEVVIDNPIQTSSTSFISIENVLKRHEGIYVCRVLDRKVLGKLIVKSKPVLTVNPKEITVKPGGTARYLCKLTGIEGKLIWRRRDKKSFIENKETRMGGDTNSLLEIKQATTADDGTVYECIFNKLTEYVTLWVKDDCALSQRKCQNNTCIDENKFCDGKNDCGDNSDEDPKRCNECTPNSIHCDFLNSSIPTKRCVVKHWQCDGVDDCGNNFDELNCPVKNKDKCLGSHFQCGNETLIPRAYWCDGEPDCKSMEDEMGCTFPQVIDPAKSSQLTVLENTTLTIDCQISGRPIPTITWRYNWGYLPYKLDHNITDVVTNCSIITSTLRINNISPEHSGIYTCEGIAKRRVMAPDVSVTVTKGSVCKRPFFNNDAWDQELCLRCYCSNVTDDCTSASGYIINPDPIESQARSSDAAVINYKNNVYYEPARPVSFANETLKMYIINKENYKKLIPDDDHFLGGSFNMRGSWINRYGFPLTYKLTLGGESVGHISGPILVMVGHSDKKIFYCSPKYRLPAYASDDNTENNMRIILWEKDRWFVDDMCSKSVTRPEFIEILRDVRLVLFRVRYFTKQTDFKMSKISMQEAIKSKYEHSWIPRIEKCNCPDGYSGLSCENKSS